VNVFGAVSYGAAAVSLLALTLLLGVSWQGRAVGARLIAAAAVSALWAAALAFDASAGPLPVQAVYAAEVIRGAAWIVMLLALARSILPTALRWGGHALWIGLLAAEVLGAERVASLLAPAGLALALAVLVLLEQVYRNANADGRAAFRLLALGLGGVFVYDVFMYADALLLGGLSEDLWAARGFVNALLPPFVAIAARRNPHWSLDVFVSRQVVIFTSALVAVGLYLLAMAAGGYLVRQFGGSWGRAANVVFLAGAGLVLAYIILSGAARRRLFVFVSKHFYRNKYDYRVEWLRFVETLSGGGDRDIRTTCLRAIAQIFESPGAILFTRSEAGAQFDAVAAWPMPLEHVPGLAPVPASHELLRFMVQKNWVVDLREHAAAPEFYQNVAIPEGLGRRDTVRVLLPLLEAEGLAGFVLLYDPPPPFELTYEDRDLLKTVGRHVATIVAQQEADRRLAENRQFEAYHRLTAFMMHDLKNSVAQLKLVVSNADRHRHNPAFIDDSIATIGNAVERMTRLIEQLRETGRAASAESIEVGALARDVASRCADRAPAVDVARLPRAPVFVEANRERLASALEHVIRNAQDACGRSGSVALELQGSAAGVQLTVADTGCGMSAEFLRERLFRPFDSTKGSKGMGIGAFQVREYVRSVGGEVEVQSAPGAGTRFNILLPVRESVRESELADA
jgi:putative PEP-CTERM system histidine kinase